MLVLSRKLEESVMVEGSDDLGHTLKVTVLQICGDEVRLGFEGPVQIAVHRQEVWDRIRAGVRPRLPTQRLAAPSTQVVGARP